MLFIIYFAFIVLFVMQDAFKFMHAHARAIETTFLMSQLITVLYALFVARGCVVVRSRKHEGVRP